MKKFERDPTVGSIVTDLLSPYTSHVGGMAPTCRRRHVVLVPRNCMKNSLRKLVKKFKSDPTRAGSFKLTFGPDTVVVSVERPQPDAVYMQYRFHATPSKTASGNS